MTTKSVHHAMEEEKKHSSSPSVFVLLDELTSKIFRLKPQTNTSQCARLLLTVNTRSQTASHCGNHRKHFCCVWSFGDKYKTLQHLLLFFLELLEGYIIIRSHLLSKFVHTTFLIRKILH